MLPKPKKEVIIATPRHELKINCYYGFIELNKVKVKKELFSDMCKTGCRNFNCKYSCPPFSPNFFSYVKDSYLFVLILKINLEQLSGHDYNEYHKLRIGNAVIKPRIEKIMRSLENNFNSRFLSTGACRLCKLCQRKLSNPCKYPDKMRFSLESLGVDCNQLTSNLFNLPLLWYTNKKTPEYTLVISALPINNLKQKGRIIKLIEKELDKISA